MPLLMIIFLGLITTTPVEASVENIPLKSNVELLPNQTETVTVETSEPTEIGWRTTQAVECTTNCVQALDVTGGINYTIATLFGAAMKYTPVEGKIIIEYKNISNQPVTINVFKVHRTCEAEACQFLQAEREGKWLVLKVDEFKSITTSADESYSIISGTTITGKPFTVKTVWWTDTKEQLLVNCAPFVTEYLKNNTAKSAYSPYIISGRSVGKDELILDTIDTCAPLAPNFGAPPENVY